MGNGVKRCQNGDCQSDIFVISSRNKPLHYSHGRYPYRRILCLSLCRSKQTLELCRDQYQQPTRHLGGNGLKRNRRQIQLLREDSCVIKVSAIHAKYANIFEKQTTKLLSWRIYISIDFMVTTPLTSRTTGRPRRHLKKKKMAIIISDSDSHVGSATVTDHRLVINHCTGMCVSTQFLLCGHNIHSVCTVWSCLQCGFPGPLVLLGIFYDLVAIRGWLDLIFCQSWTV